MRDTGPYDAAIGKEPADPLPHDWTETNEAAYQAVMHGTLLTPRTEAHQ